MLHHVDTCFMQSLIAVSTQVLCSTPNLFSDDSLVDHCLVSLRLCLAAACVHLLQYCMHLFLFCLSGAAWQTAHCQNMQCCTATLVVFIDVLVCCVQRPADMYPCIVQHCVPHLAGLHGCVYSIAWPALLMSVPVCCSIVCCTLLMYAYVCVCAARRAPQCD